MSAGRMSAGERTPRRRMPRSGRGWTIGLSAWFAVAVVFLLAPIVAAFVYSFNVGTLGKQTATFTGWTLDWYPIAWQDDSLRRSVTTSLEVACWVAVLGLVVGGTLGLALVRHPSARVRRLLSGLTYILLIVPETVIGVSLLLFYAQTTIPLSMATLVAGQTPVVISVVALIIRSRALTLDRGLEEASADLGAGRLQTLVFVVLPHLAPAIAAGALMSYAFSFDNLVISTFLTTPEVGTLPVYLYGSLQYGPSPAVYAATTAISVVTIIGLGLALLVMRIGGRRV
ncbi:ABC transporter permease [Spelaeicoccus albus]|uniref:ABC-type spermidine/putrescine transport system permease subunit II n=1 Tax=Spelaeicoccus albus TaxID=1280376 RepID=A0A7Z0D1M2_9MICO|nr:ABC transporter permease [Spelaeicoccus albus]NYI66325.1 ABC-type spermidine/putrescine transport system permease subunit II [Spelaeicoccus albus]